MHSSEPFRVRPCRRNRCALQVLRFFDSHAAEQRLCRPVVVELEGISGSHMGHGVGDAVRVVRLVGADFVAMPQDVAHVDDRHHLARQVQRCQRQQPVVSIEEVVRDEGQLAALQHRPVLHREAVEAIGVARQQAARVRRIRAATDVDVAVDVAAVSEAFQARHDTGGVGVDALQQRAAGVEHGQRALVVSRDREPPRGHARREGHQAAMWRIPRQRRRGGQHADVAEPLRRVARGLGARDRVVHLLALHHAPRLRVPVDHLDLAAHSGASVGARLIENGRRGGDRRREALIDRDHRCDARLRAAERQELALAEGRGDGVHREPLDRDVDAAQHLHHAGGGVGKPQVRAVRWRWTRAAHVQVDGATDGERFRAEVEIPRWQLDGCGPGGGDGRIDEVLQRHSVLEPARPGRQRLLVRPIVRLGRKTIAFGDIRADRRAGAAGTAGHACAQRRPAFQRRTRLPRELQPPVRRQAGDPSVDVIVEQLRVGRGLCLGAGDPVEGRALRHLVEHRAVEHVDLGRVERVRQLPPEEAPGVPRAPVEGLDRVTRFVMRRATWKHDGQVIGARLLGSRGVRHDVLVEKVVDRLEPSDRGVAPHCPGGDHSEAAVDLGPARVRLAVAREVSPARGHAPHQRHIDRVEVVLDRARRGGADVALRILEAEPPDCQDGPAAMVQIAVAGGDPQRAGGEVLPVRADGAQQRLGRGAGDVIHHGPDAARRRGAGGDVLGHLVLEVAAPPWAAHVGEEALPPDAVDAGGGHPLEVPRHCLRVRVGV